MLCLIQNEMYYVLNQSAKYDRIKNIKNKKSFPTFKHLYINYYN